MSYGAPRKRLRVGRVWRLYPASLGCLTTHRVGVLGCAVYGDFILHVLDVLRRTAEVSYGDFKPLFLFVFGLRLKFCFGGAYFLEDFLIVAYVTSPPSFLGLQALP